MRGYSEVFPRASRVCSVLYSCVAAVCDVSMRGMFVLASACVLMRKSDT